MNTTATPLQDRDKLARDLRKRFGGLGPGAHLLKSDLALIREAATALTHPRPLPPDVAALAQRARAAAHSPVMDTLDASVALLECANLIETGNLAHPREEIGEERHCAFVDRFGNEVRTSRAAYQEIRWLRDRLETVVGDTTTDDAYDVIRGLLAAINDIPAGDCPPSLQRALTATFAFLDKSPSSPPEDANAKEGDPGVIDLRAPEVDAVLRDLDQAIEEGAGHLALECARIIRLMRAEHRRLFLASLNRVSIADETLARARELAESLQWHMYEGPGIARRDERDIVDQLVAALSSAPTPIDGEDGR